MPSDPTHHLEVERKFDVADAAPAPSFAGVEAVATVEGLPAQALDAVYFDTPGHDLAARSITLRRRTGGTDSGWHLKLPAGPDARTEVRAPLGDGDDRVPAELLDLVLAVVRDRPVAPVARITTHRDIRLLHGAGGAALAEFCDDRVTASTVGAPDTRTWREWELELTDPAAEPGLLELLSGSLLASGAAPAGHASKLARALGPAPAAPVHPDRMHRAVAEQVDQLLVWDRAVRQNADDAVHQLRVTIRKIRSLLQSSGQAAVGDELRWLAGPLGVARDAEVLAQRYRQALDRLPARLVRGPVRERLVDTAERRYREGWQQALVAMRSARYFRLLDDLDALVAAPAAGGAGSAASVSVATAYRRVCKAARHAARAAGDADRDEALHRIRKAAKRLRYTAAAAGETQIALRAKTIQTLLGDHQDSVVSRAHLLRATDTAAAAGEDTFSYGLLYQQEEELAADRHAQLDQALAELAEAMGEGERVGL